MAANSNQYDEERERVYRDDDDGQYSFYKVQKWTMPQFSRREQYAMFLGCWGFCYFLHTPLNFLILENPTLWDQTFLIEIDEEFYSLHGWFYGAAVFVPCAIYNYIISNWY